MKGHISSRRRFVKNSVITGTGITIVPRHVLGGTGYTAPSDKVEIGVIGVGGRGKENVRDLLNLDNVQVTCIADPAEYWDLHDFYYQTEAGWGPVKKMIDDHYRSKGMSSDIRTYVDFRQMLAQEESLDAVLCATPDHTHAYVSVTSMRAGKHVYCEKPLTHNIWEARLVQQVAKDTGLATQMGNQLHSSKGIRGTVEILRSGILGQINEVHAWVGATRWIPTLKGLPKGHSAMPYGFDWNLWVGPRAMRPYHKDYTPVTWRDFWDFGCGAMGDFGCHDLDAPVWGLDLPLPSSVELRPAGFSNEEVTPFGEIGYYQFEKEDGSKTDLTWYSGGLRPPTPPELYEGAFPPGRGALYRGTNGMMIYRGGWQDPLIFPESLATEVANITPTLPEAIGHHAEWVRAIKDGGSTGSNFEYAGHLTEITLLGVLSLRLGGRKLNWDAEQMIVSGMPEADQFIKEEIRDGWEMG